MKNEVAADWMRRYPEIFGIGVGLDANGTPVLIVYVDRNATNAGEVIRNLPREVRGIGVLVKLTDRFRPL